jgi:hypothetical protein
MAAMIVIDDFRRSPVAVHLSARGVTFGVMRRDGSSMRLRMRMLTAGTRRLVR